MSGYRKTERDPVSAEQVVGLLIIAAGLVMVCLFATAGVGGADWLGMWPWDRLPGLLSSFALLVLSGSFLFQAGMPDAAFKPARRSISARRRLLRTLGWLGTALYLAVIVAALLEGAR